MSKHSMRPIWKSAHIEPQKSPLLDLLTLAVSSHPSPSGPYSADEHVRIHAPPCGPCRWWHVRILMIGCWGVRWGQGSVSFAAVWAEVVFCALLSVPCPQIHVTIKSGFTPTEADEISLAKGGSIEATPAIDTVVLTVCPHLPPCLPVVSLLAAHLQTQIGGHSAAGLQGSCCYGKFCKNIFDIVITHNDEISYAKHV